MTVTVADNPIVSRYEARIDAKLAGVCEYELTLDTIASFRLSWQTNKARDRLGNREVCP